MTVLRTLIDLRASAHPIAGHRQQPAQAEHGAVPGRAGGQDRARRRPGDDRGPAHPGQGTAQAAEEAAQVAGTRGQHVPVVRHGPGPHAAALNADRRGRSHRSGGQAVQLESYLALVLFCVLASASYLSLEIYAVVKPGQSQVLLARFRTWLDTHTDQVIIIGSLLLGFWLIANSIYLITT